MEMKKNRNFSGKIWKCLEINISEKFLLEEKIVKNVKKFIRRLKKFEIFT
jgi:hypothetical protein